MATIAVQSLKQAETYLWNEISQSLHCGFYKAPDREALIMYAAQVKGALQAQILADKQQEELEALLFKRIDLAMNKLLKKRGWTQSKTELIQPLQQAIQNVNALKKAMVQMDEKEIDWKATYMAASYARNEHYLSATYADRERIIILINLHNLKHPEQAPIRFGKL